MQPQGTLSSAPRTERKSIVSRDGLILASHLYDNRWDHLVGIWLREKQEWIGWMRNICWLHGDYLNLPIFYIGEERLETEECFVLLPWLARLKWRASGLMFLSFLSTSRRCARKQSPSFRRLVSPMGYNPMGYNYFAYEVLHGVQVMHSTNTLPVYIHRKRDRN